MVRGGSSGYAFIKEVLWREAAALRFVSERREMTKKKIESYMDTMQENWFK
jgi:hypothetical protein